MEKLTVNLGYLDVSWDNEHIMTLVSKGINWDTCKECRDFLHALKMSFGNQWGKFRHKGGSRRKTWVDGND